ncbi:hypothetical protein [Mucilaginibacter auburnensis]|uniref:Splicing factor 3B subunit 10 (SF3b10) n=1 Tax=Mucilaginibacter auburnensis TaxID=1457233 RepID=A0A2H9VNH1_9SPHI|nr:hypothetical protein [Mucilaginibacter auburnensis]PJJ79879.1 splicing factor 3B subunit 10 (SF3b10) [Mucilaginibacter auburnensis]
MNLQYISDNNGETTGVYIPIQEWNELKSKFKGIEQEEINVPDWHIKIVRDRYEKYLENPKQGLDFDEAMRDIDKEL